jgi:hypothetical protein
MNVSKFIGLIFFTLCLAISACKKSKPDPENEVIYTVVETSNDEPEFTVIYKTPQGDKTEGPFKANSWLSKKLPDFERGDYVSLIIESKNGKGSFTSSVYLNGLLLKEEKMDFPYFKKLEAVLPPSY